MRTIGTRKVVVFLVAVVAMASAPAVHGAVYPTNRCVSVKQSAAAAYCQSTLNAWKGWERNQDVTQRDLALAKASTKLTDSWTKVEANTTKKNVTCAETTAAVGDIKALVDAAVGTLVTDVNVGLDRGNKKHVACGAALLGAAAINCNALLAADSRLVVNKPKGKVWGWSRTKHDQDQADARTKFAKSFTTATAPPKVCPTTATAIGLQSSLDTVAADVDSNTTVSPNVDNTKFTTISPMGTIKYLRRKYTPTCMDGSPYHFFVKRGSVNKLLIYYQGGGACWENLTCSLPACDTNVDPTSGDNPNNQHSGFGDISNPLNPFKDWNVVFVSYCSCDIHFGDAAQDYVGGLFPPIHVEHRGYQNARVAEKWAREHFVNPERILVTGSSAGAYGAWFNAPLHEAIWPASHFDVLADAGNGVITQDFLDNEFPNWNFAANLPPTIPGLKDTLTNGTGIPGYTSVVTSFFPDTRWAHYATAFDGGQGGQTGFYQVMLNPTNAFVWPNWWLASCRFHAKMRQQVIDTAAANPLNYRYYIGSGSRHTMWGSNKVYTDTTGGVPLLLDWVNAMLAGDPGWINVEASPSNLLLSDDPMPVPTPTPQPAPFAQSGADFVVNCP